MQGRRANFDTAKMKKKFLEAFSECGFVSIACRNVGITPSCHNNWKRADAQYFEEFKEIADIVRESNIDIAESSLMNNIKDGKEASIMFYLKCQAKHRGYVQQNDKHEATDADVPLFPDVL